MTDETAKGTEVAVVESAPRVRSLGNESATGLTLSELFQKGFFVAARQSDVIRISVSLACWEVISQDVSKTPLELRRRTPNGSVLVQPNEHPVAKMLWRRPSEYYGWKEWLRMAAAHLAAARMYYAAARWDRRGRAIELQGVQPNRVVPYMNVDAGRYFYQVTPASDHDRIQWSWLVDKTAVSSDDIVPMRLRSLNGLDPISNADVARDALGLLGKMHEFQRDSFAGGGVGINAVTFPDGLSDEQYNRLKKDLEASFERSQRSGKPILLEGSDGVVPVVKRLSISAVDSDFVQSNIAAMNDVLRYYRVPPPKVGIFEEIKYDNLDSVTRTYVDDTLVPIFECIEDGLDRLLLSSDADDELFFRFDRDAAYAQDPKLRTEIILSQWKAGALEYDEMRQKLGMNTYGGDAGKARQISGNFVLIDRDNNVILKAGGNAPGAEGDQAPQDEAGANAGKELGDIGNVVPIRN